MKDLIEGFERVAIASVAHAVDMVCGRRGYMDATIKPRIKDQRVVGPAQVPVMVGGVMVNVRPHLTGV